jgi:hypothetical protein
MNRKKKVFFAAAIVGVMSLFVIALVVKLKAPPDGDSANSTTLLGGLFQRASAVSQLKELMGDLREAYPAMTKFAKEHQDDLPNTVAELRPYLPAKLARLDDTHWELPAKGKMGPITRSPDANDTVLLRQKTTEPGKARINLCADGHIEYSAR